MSGEGGLSRHFSHVSWSPRYSPPSTRKCGDVEQRVVRAAFIDKLRTMILTLGEPLQNYIKPFMMISDRRVSYNTPRNDKRPRREKILWQIHRTGPFFHTARVAVEKTARCIDKQGLARGMMHLYYCGYAFLFGLGCVGGAYSRPAH